MKSIDHELATSPKVPAEAHTKETLESNQRQALYYYGAPHDQRRQHTTRQRGTDLSPRTVANSLSGASVTHDEYRTFTVVQVV